MKHTMKKLVAFLMALLMALEMTPVSALADSFDTNPVQTGGGADVPQRTVPGFTVTTLVDPSFTGSLDSYHVFVRQVNVQAIVDNNPQTLSPETHDALSNTVNNPKTFITFYYWGSREINYNPDYNTVVSVKDQWGNTTYDAIDNFPISYEYGKDSVIVKIGTVASTYSATVTGLPAGFPQNTYKIKATVGTDTYYAPVNGNGDAAFTDLDDGLLPGAATEIKFVDSDDVERNVITVDNVRYQIAIGGPEGNTYTVTATALTDCTATLLINDVSGLDTNASYYIKATTGLDETGYARVQLDTNTNTLAFKTAKDGETALIIDDQTTFQFVDAADQAVTDYTLDAGTLGGDHQYGLALTKQDLSRHTAFVTLDEGVTTTPSFTFNGSNTECDLYVVFSQPVSGSGERAYGVSQKVTQSGEYTVPDTFFAPQNGTQPYDAAAETTVFLMAIDKYQNGPQAWMFYGTDNGAPNLGNNKNRVFHSEDNYPDSASSDIVIISQAANNSKKTNIHIGAAACSARLDLFEQKNVAAGDVTFDSPYTLTATKDGTTYTATVTGNGEIDFGANGLPAGIAEDAWVFTLNGAPVTELGDGYVFESAVLDGTVYVLTARKPDTYGVAVDFYDAWSTEAAARVTTEEIDFAGLGIDEFEGPQADDIKAQSGDLTYKIKVENKKAEGKIVLKIEKEAQPGAGGPGAGGPGANALTEILKVDDNGWTIGKESFGVAGNIGPYAVTFDSSNPEIENYVYIIKAQKPKTYGADITFYGLDGGEEETVSLPAGYTVVAVSAEDANVTYTGAVETDGEITWELDTDEALPKISEFKFQKNGADTEYFGDYKMSVESLDDEDLYDTTPKGTYQIRADLQKCYPARLQYSPENSTPLTANYYIVALQEDEMVAYAAVPATSGPLTFIAVDGAASGSVLDIWTLVGSAGGLNETPSGMTLRADTTFKLVTAENTDAATLAAAAEKSKIDNYSFKATPVIEGEGDNATLVFTASGEMTTNRINIVTNDYDGSTPKAPSASPAKPLLNDGGTYYLRVRVQKKDNQGVWQNVGWTAIPITSVDQNSSTIASVTVDNYVPLNKPYDERHSQTPYVPGVNRIDTSDGQAIRLIKVKQSYWKNDFATACNPQAVSDDRPDNYKYMEGSAADTGDWNVNLKRAKDSDYYVRLQFNGANELEDVIAFDGKPGSVWALVTLEHKSGNVTYGLVKIEDSMKQKTADGKVVIDVPITAWKNMDGSNASDGYTDQEKSVKIDLVAVPDGVTPTHNHNQYNPGVVGGEPIPKDQYINNYKIINDYSVKKTLVKADDPDYVPDDHFTEPHPTDITKENVYDVVVLEKNTAKFTDSSLEYVLNGYNLVALCENGNNPKPGNNGATYSDGDVYLITHCMGGVLVRGDLIYAGGSGVADSWVVTKPSVVGGKLYQDTDGGAIRTGNSVNTRNNPNPPDFYLGAGSTVYGFVVNGVNLKQEIGGIKYTYNPYGLTIADPNYIDWDQLQSDMVSASNSLYSKSTRVIEVNSSNSEGIEIHAGEIVTLVLADERIQPTIHIIGDSNMSSTNPTSTIINVAGDTLFVPLITKINGVDASHYLNYNSTVNAQAQAQQKEDGSGMSILFNMPEASKVYLTSDDVIGHVLAPAADIRVLGGNYNGCLVGNSVSTEGEGHQWPYNGPKGTLVPTNEGFTAQKTVNGHIPVSGETYSFILREFNNGQWQVKETKQNNGSLVAFTQITYGPGSEGSHFYLISEDTTNAPDGVIADTALYLVHVRVKKVVNGQDTQYLSTVKYFKIKDDADLSNVLTLIDGAYSLNLSTMVGANTVKFDNKKQGGLTIKKAVSGTDAKDVTFTFKITLTETDNEEGTLVFPADFAAQVTNQAKGTVTFAVAEAGNNKKGEATFELRNGEGITFEGIPEGVLYAVEETKIKGQNIVDGTAIDGYIRLEAPANATGEITGSAQSGILVTFNNEYNASGSVTLKASKAENALLGENESTRRTSSTTRRRVR